MTGSVAALTVAAALLVGFPATSSAASTSPASGNISVGAISSLTGAIAADFDAFVPGMQAYFDMVNAAGGVNGHKLVLAANLDDAGNPSQFTQLTHTLLQQDHVSAVAISTFFFNPSLYVQSGVPTYGYNVSNNWVGPANLFAAGGSVQNYTAGVAPISWIIKQTKSKSVAVMSYGSAITSSFGACNAFANGLKAAGVTVSYTDLSAQLGGNYSSAVQKMQQSGTDFVLSCLQSSDNITLARSIQQYGLKVHQLWLSGYDQTVLNQYSSLMQGVYFNVNGNVPFQAVKAFPGSYPGMQQYLAAMQKYEPKFAFNDQALQGWQSAALLAAGVQKAGSDLTPANIVAQTNKITNFTAGGLSAVTDWTKLHTTQTYPACSAFVKVTGSKFIPVAIKGHQVFACFNKKVNYKNPIPVTPPPGTPGT
ncbi:MAG TPA: ABC transporter substrate-binding protein [Acidimicrobiales bacterium]|nr:ABC transporter substrate-binding protein [Acidimicrobiales bacterium]